MKLFVESLSRLRVLDTKVRAGVDISDTGAEEAQVTPDEALPRLFYLMPDAPESTQAVSNLL